MFSKKTFFVSLPFVNVWQVFCFLFLATSYSYSVSLSASCFKTYPNWMSAGGSASMSCSYALSNGNLVLTALGHEFSCSKSYNLSGSTYSLESITTAISTSATNCAGHSNVCSSSSCNSGDISPCSSPQSGNALYSSISCSASFLIDNAPSLPACSDFLPVSLEFCKGGQGLLSQGTTPHAGAIVADAFGSLSQIYDANNNPTGLYNTTSAAQVAPVFSHYQNTSYDTLPRPDGSSCVNNTVGQIFDFYICPLGFVADFELPSGSSTASSSSGEGGDEGQSSSSSIDFCVEFPLLPGCGGGGGNDSTGAGMGADCSDFSNCDWSKLSVQLAQLEVDVETRNKVGDVVTLLNNGYNISTEQLNELKDLRNDLIGSVGSGANNIVSAINSLVASNNSNSSDVVSVVNSLNNSNTSGFADVVGAVNGLADGLNGLGGSSGGVAEGVSGGLADFAVDSTGTGDYNSFLDSLGAGGSTGSQMGDSLGDGSVARNRIKTAVGIDSTDFAFFGYSDQCPVYDMSFTSGVSGISCSDCTIDLCNIHGFNAGEVLRAIVWLFALLSVLFMNLEILRTGGHS